MSKGSLTFVTSLPIEVSTERGKGSVLEENTTTWQLWRVMLFSWLLMTTRPNTICGFLISQYCTKLEGGEQTLLLLVTDTGANVGQGLLSDVPTFYHSRTDMPATVGLFICYFCANIWRTFPYILASPPRWTKFVKGAEWGTSLFGMGKLDLGLHSGNMKTWMFGFLHWAVRPCVVYLVQWWTKLCCTHIYCTTLVDHTSLVSLLNIQQWTEAPKTVCHAKERSQLHMLSPLPLFLNPLPLFLNPLPLFLNPLSCEQALHY